MVNPIDRRILAEISAMSSDLIGVYANEFIETELSLIMPLGASRGFAIDKDGYIIGLKIGSIREGATEALNKICRLSRLRRLIFFSNENCELPSAVKNLKELNLVWLSGGFIRLAPEILELNLPIFTTDSSGLDSFFPRLRNDSINILQQTESEVRNQEDIVREKRSERSDSDFDDIKNSGHRREKALQSILSPTLSKSLLDITGIYLVSLSRLEDPPLEIAQKGHEAIERYFHERGINALPLNELKVILVGNGSAGKTSLVKSLFNEKFDVDEPQTHGINIRSKSITTQNNKNVKLNFWDFGGQEIMHATHQFFLSKRSMYILVLDGRKEEDPEYWLQHIESFGGESPIIIILNKIDEHPSFEVNRRFLKAKYKGIVDFFRVSCSARKGISDFSSRLFEELDNVPMIQTLWPRDWFKVKRRLEQLTSSYISLRDYYSICKNENVLERKNQELLVEFLNDLGVVLHFKDIQLLDMHVLDPRWVTEAVYRIINWEQLSKQKGIFHLNQTETALLPRKAEERSYPPNTHQYIIDLMLKFELCYQLDDKSILIPDLIDIQEPAIDFENKDALQFVFDYTYLPKSIMTRLIVRMHKDIQTEMRWRTGMVLREKSFEATALIIADEKAKKIYVSVNGVQKRDYFAVIRKSINDLNSSFEKLTVTELVPLADASGILVDYKELLGYEQAKREEIFIGRLGRTFKVSTLLNGIEAELSRQNVGAVTINVQGDYIANSDVSKKNTYQEIQTVNQNFKTMSYQPHNWEKIVVYITGFLFIGVISFLAIRNQTINDKNLVVFLRIILSIVIAIFGATIPGMLKVDYSAKGISIRAIGALALFVIAFVLTPKVL